jgi:hypothetical protein
MEFAKLFLRNLLVELEKRNFGGDSSDDDSGEEEEEEEHGGMEGMPITAEEGQSLTINIYRGICIPQARMEKGGKITMNIHDDTDITLCIRKIRPEEDHITIEAGGELIINTVGSALPIINKISLLKYIDKETGSKLTINYNANL